MKVLLTNGSPHKVGNNMAYFLHCKESAQAMGIMPPKQEPMIFTNFIR